MDSDWYKYFLADAQRLPNGRLASDTHIRKYRDAVMWGAKISKQCLPLMFRMEIQSFHKSKGSEMTTSLHDKYTINLGMYVGLCPRH